MRVGVERQGYLRMAERLHDDTRIHALSEQQRSARVTEIVKPHIGEFRGRQQSLELSRHVPRLQGRSDRASQHEVSVLPTGASCKTRLKLAGPVGP